MRRRYRFGDPKPTHCLRGHELTTENVRVRVNHTGRAHRTCRACERESNRRYYANNTEKRREYGRRYDAQYRADGRKKRALPAGTTAPYGSPNA